MSYREAGNSQVTLSSTAPASDSRSQVSGFNVFEGTAADLSQSAPVTNVAARPVALAALIEERDRTSSSRPGATDRRRPGVDEASAVPLVQYRRRSHLDEPRPQVDTQVDSVYRPAPTSGGTAVSDLLIFGGKPGRAARPATVPVETAPRHRPPQLHDPQPDQRDDLFALLRVITVNAAGPGPPPCPRKHQPRSCVSCRGFAPSECPNVRSTRHARACGPASLATARGPEGERTRMARPALLNRARGREFSPGLSR